MVIVQRAVPFKTVKRFRQARPGLNGQMNCEHAAQFSSSKWFPTVASWQWHSTPRKVFLLFSFYFFLNPSIIWCIMLLLLSYIFTNLSSRTVAGLSELKPGKQHFLVVMQKPCMPRMAILQGMVKTFRTFSESQLFFFFTKKKTCFCRLSLILP